MEGKLTKKTSRMSRGKSSFWMGSKRVGKQNIRSGANNLACGKNEVRHRLVVFLSGFGFLTYLSEVSAEAVVFASSGFNFVAYASEVNVKAFIFALVCFFEIAFAL
jgi:hypothetical protein